MRRSFLAGVVLTLLVTAAVYAAAPQPAAAFKPIWEEGNAGHPFTLATPLPSAVAVLGTDDQRLELERKTLVEIGPEAPMWGDRPPTAKDPRMAYPLSNGHVIICGGKVTTPPFVMEVDATGTVIWQYTNDDTNGGDGLMVRPFSAEPATFSGERCLLISDRGTFEHPGRVFAVTWDDAKSTVWQYGGTLGVGVNQLEDPFCATQIPASGNVLIADSNGANRVIEVQASDYDPSDPSPARGYTAESIVWQYGVTGQAGSDPGHLNKSRSPQRLPSGDTMIADSDGKRILVVKTSDYDPGKPDNGYTAGSIVWSYVNGVDGLLEDPNTARYITSGPLAGKVLVADCGATTQWVRIIDYATKRVDWTLEMSTYERPAYVKGSDKSEPRDARIGPDGALWMADSAFSRVLKMGNEGKGTAQSQWLDCGYPDMVKAYKRIKIEAPTLPSGTGFSLWYSRDGIAFTKAKPDNDRLNFTLPGGVWGTRFAYKVVLTSKDRWVTPVFPGLVIHFMKAKTGGNGPGGGGDTPGGSGNSGQSGVYAYPSTAEGGTGTSGTGTGSGGSGSGTGSGSYGTGSGSAGAGAGSSSVANSVEVPVQSSGSGDAQEVQGYQVQGEEGVSGVPLRAEEGAQAPEPERPGPAVPVLALVVAGLVVAAAFFVPWPFVAAHLRHITGFDHTRPARFLPFRPLGK